MPSKLTSREGFTLLEILVVLVLLGLLIGAVVPNILNQTSKGEANRVLRDLAAVESAAKTFRVDVGRWPGALAHLQAVPTDSTDVNGTAYPAGALNRWDGPYIEGMEIDGDSIGTAAGVGIEGFSVAAAAMNGEDYLSVSIPGLSDTHYTTLDIEIDGAADSTSGRLRKTSGTAYYLAAPLR